MSETVRGRQVFVAALASIFGWGLDLFDLFILLYVAPVVGKLFFPADNPMLSLAAIYASFAVTLLIRPLGAALFGSLADRGGRRRALMIAVVGVGVSTAAFGLLPTVATAGWVASALFLVLRLVQGVFVGGVVASSHTIGTESVPERWRGLMSGAVGGGGSALGGLCASLVLYLVTRAAPGPAFADWGWRVMFFSGLLTSVVGLLLFRGLEESPIFVAAQARREARRAAPRTPLGALFSRAHRGAFLLNLALTFGAGAGYYLTSGYLPTFLNVARHVPGTQASLILVVANLTAAAGALSAGALSQRIGRKPVFLLAGVARLAAFPLLYLAMGTAQDLWLLAAETVALSFVANASYGHLLIFLNERFPTELRATGTGLSWNVGFALGGMMPTFVSLAASGASSLASVLAIFCTGVSVVYLAGAIAVPETRGNLVRG